jgi:hypothetical protein
LICHPPAYPDLVVREEHAAELQQISAHGANVAEHGPNVSPVPIHTDKTANSQPVRST